MLVLMLIITPRTFFVGGASGGVGLLGRRGLISGSQGSTSIIGVGSRPWLQKVAAIGVAVSLTIATADTFDVAERQYMLGIMNANDLRIEVSNSLQIKISKIVSDFFVWLAQVQTLIRIFPRHKEKVLIKWVGFCLIILDSIFSCLDSFVMGESVTVPQRLSSAVPALSYVFQLALGTLYAAWVLYFVGCKRRYAFYHPLMWNISVVALLSVIAIITPIVFFVTDLANPTIAAWGDYFRWVGAAAASGIVWEWVERIEALEREEKKDGILGVEIFDEESAYEEDMDGSYSSSGRRYWFGGLRRRQNNSNSNNRDSSSERSTQPPVVTPPPPRNTARRTSQASSPLTFEAAKRSLATPVQLRPQTNSPISRTDTASASTIYSVQYNTLNVAMPPVFRPGTVAPTTMTVPEETAETEDEELSEKAEEISSLPLSTPPQKSFKSSWFNRKKALPPAEVRQGRVIETASLGELSRSQPIHQYATWDVKGRIGAFAAEHAENWRERRSKTHVLQEDLPITIIPAQTRRRVVQPSAAGASGTSDMEGLRPQTNTRQNGSEDQLIQTIEEDATPCVEKREQTTRDL
jgi:hypothetical protein